MGGLLQLIGEVLLGQRNGMVPELLQAFGVASVGVIGINHCADVRVLQILAVHFCEAQVLGSTDEREGAVQFVIVVCGFDEDMVSCHVSGDCVHGLLGEE